MKYIMFDLESKEIISVGPEDCHIINGSKKFSEKAFYETDSFHNYHEKFCERVYKVYNVCNGKLYGIYYFGLKGGVLKMPYSSPFSIFSIRNTSNLSIIDSIIKGIKTIAINFVINSIRITLPPGFYFNRFSEFHITLKENGFFVDYSDINHYLDLEQFKDIDEYLNYIPYSTRKHIKRAEKANLKFRELLIDDIEQAYKVIAINRREDGYPLKMSLNHIKDIQQIQGSDMRSFVIESECGQVYAAAITMDVTDNISQVIYWGDIRKYSQDRPMNKLCVELIKYFKNSGKKILDIGPSSEYGKINSGLSEFKRGLGCSSNLKYTYRYDLK